jgi:DedD protein
MAFFKFRKSGDDTAAAAPAESVEVMRRRARHRLIGAAVLVLIGVVGFPLLFDTQPRPVQVDIPIDIPDRAKAKPLASAPAQSTTSPAQTTPACAACHGPPRHSQQQPRRGIWSGTAPAAPAKPAPAPKVAQAEGLDAKEEIVPAKPAPVSKPAASAPVVAKAEAKPEAKPAAAPKPDDGAEPRPCWKAKLRLWRPLQPALPVVNVTWCRWAHLPTPTRPAKRA